jgi:hypothetical protein
MSDPTQWEPVDDDNFGDEAIAWIDEHLSNTVGDAFRLEPWQRGFVGRTKSGKPFELDTRKLRSKPPRDAGEVSPSYVILDELDSTAPRRELIVVREDGSSYGANVPADFDLGDVLQPGEVVGFDCGGAR